MVPYLATDQPRPEEWSEEDEEAILAWGEDELELVDEDDEENEA